jgi:hypothetical protein
LRASDRIVTLAFPGSGDLVLFSQSVTGAPVIRFAVAATLLLVFCTSGRGADTERAWSTQFLMMSDLHFDPMADPKLVDRLCAVEPEEWPGILESSDKKAPARYGADSNWVLLHSTLQQTKQILPNPAFVVMPGDLLGHNFRREFDTAAADHSDAAYRLFVRKTMQFLASQLEQTFPDTPILPALGNDDSCCGNYQLQPQGPFLAETR